MQNRKQAIELFGKGFQQLTEALKQFPKEMWEFKPSGDRWSIHEILVHIADSEANAFVKCRKLIAQPGKSVNDYDQNVWSEALHYREQNIEGSLKLFKWLRQNTYALIKELPDTIWSNASGYGEDGIVTLDHWLEIYANHVTDHIKQMKKNYTAWQKQLPA
ncbi:MAG: DinB family protein [Candidatus Scalindua sp.]|nr:DinB family protein [Candidatus Scalindua sp.]